MLLSYFRCFFSVPIVEMLPVGGMDESKSLVGHVYTCPTLALNFSEFVVFGVIILSPKTGLVPRVMSIILRISVASNFLNVFVS